LNELPQDDSRSIIAANCHYIENKWKITINPILACYKNESDEFNWTSPNRPKLPLMNSPVPDVIYENGGVIDLPPVLTDLGYTVDDLDTSNWLGEYGENRKEIDIRDRFIKIRIRYSGEELAVVKFLNTIYRISYA
jgi:hypothetical protein